MKKLHRFAAAALCLLLGAGLAGCGKKAAAPAGLVGTWKGEDLGFKVTYTFRADGTGNYDAVDLNNMDFVYRETDGRVVIVSADYNSLIGDFAYSVRGSKLTFTDENSAKWSYTYSGAPSETPAGAKMPGEFDFDAVLAGETGGETSDTAVLTGPDAVNDCIDMNGDWKGLAIVSNAQGGNADLDGCSIPACLRIAMQADNTGEFCLGISLSPYPYVKGTPVFDDSDRFCIRGITLWEDSAMGDLCFETGADGLLTASSSITLSGGNFDLTFHFCRWEEEWPGTGDLAFSDDLAGLFGSGTFEEVLEGDYFLSDGSDIPQPAGELSDAGDGGAGGSAARPEDNAAAIASVLADWRSAQSPDTENLAAMCAGITDAIDGAGLTPWLEEDICYIYDPQDGSVLRIGYMDTGVQYEDRDYVIMNSEVGLIVENYGASYASKG